jgi:hypothetical protein
MTTTMNTDDSLQASDRPIDTPADARPQTVTGRSIFAVETTAAGVSVQTAFLSDTGEGQVPQLLAMPAVFPDQTYALDQIDRLRAAVVQHFAQAARVGAQVLAQHAAQQAQANAAKPALAAEPTLA